MRLYYALFVSAAFFLSLFCSSCGHKQFHTTKSFDTWLGDAGNGCCLEKRIGGVCISVKYLPPSYLVAKDYRDVIDKSSDKARDLDSLLRKQKQQTSFVVTIGPDKTLNKERQASSIMSQGVEDQSSFLQRVWSSNFLKEQYFSLQSSGTEIKPALCLIENTNEFPDTRTFDLVFDKRSYFSPSEKDDVVFMYDDPYFNIGKVQFNFSSKALEIANDAKVNVF